MIKPTGKLLFAYNTITALNERIAELEKEVEKERRHYDALNNIRVDLLVRVKNLEAKALKEQDND
jgi:uncharacterized coiled-coil protein SlyX